MWQAHYKPGIVCHSPFNRKLRPLMPCTRTAREAVRDVPLNHRACLLTGPLTSVQYHPKSPIHNLAPSNASAIVERYPGCSPGRQTNGVMHGHICRCGGPVVNVCGFPIWRISSRDIVMVPAHYDRGANFARCDCPIECVCKRQPSFQIRIEDAGLRAHDEIVSSSFLYPF